MRISGEFLVAATTKTEPSIFIHQLRRHMSQLRPTPAARHAFPAAFIHKTFRDSSHVFLRQNTIIRALEPPHSGRHHVIARTYKTLQIFVRARHVTVSADRFKPAYLQIASQYDSNNPLAPPNSTPTTPYKTPNPPTKPTGSERNIRHPVRFTN